MREGIDYIGVGCGVLIVNDKNQILLIQRTEKSRAGCIGMWSRPGGGVEFGETMVDAMKREVLEEVGVEIELFGQMNYGDDIREENGVKYHWSTVSSFGKIISGEVQNLEPHKHQDVAWFGLDSLPENITDYTLQGIAEYREFLKNNNK